MLNFKKLSFEDAELIKQYYINCPYESCEYSAGIKLFWDEFYHYEYALSDCKALIFKYSDGESDIFEMPVLLNGQEDSETLISALDEIDDYCCENELIPVFSDIPKDLLCLFTERYNFLKIENYRTASDYIYKVEDLKYFKGRHYAGQRNHINKFKSLYPNWTVRKLVPGEDLSLFWEEYYSNLNKTSDSAVQEKSVAINMCSNFDKLSNLISGCIEVDGKIVAISVAEICGNKIIIHIEKALTSYEGIYPLLVSEFLKAFAPDEVLWVNREEDDSDKGLRISKLQYRPEKLLSKYVVIPHSELLYVQDFPVLQGERIVLDEIKKEDASAYQSLCLDDERNKLWGYDFRDDLDDQYKEKLPDDYFYRVAKNDFERRVCMNFALRLNGSFIGELVIYRADLKGSCEMGCRILPEYSGFGYGREAFALAADWAVYNAGFRQITAKCFKENSSSFKMLSSCMRPDSEDEKYFYFKKSF